MAVYESCPGKDSGISRVFLAVWGDGGALRCRGDGLDLVPVVTLSLVTGHCTADKYTLDTQNTVVQ